MSKLHHTTILGADLADVAAVRERQRQRRLGRLAIVAWLAVAWMVGRAASGGPLLPAMPWPQGQSGATMAIVVMLGCVLLLPMVAAGRSPHVLYRPQEIDVRLDDVRGAHVVKEEVVRTLNLFLAGETFARDLGGTPRRAVLFEGPPGTGKTHLAKAMAGEAGVPFLFVSSSAFQSMYHGQTNRKIRAYFRALRRAARAEGGAIGFIEEFDAIGASRSGMGGRGEGIAGVVNELLIQLQSFDEPTATSRVKGKAIDVVNLLLPASIQVRKAPVQPANILVLGATNRAADLDPALLRPGRFDRTITFDLPTRAERREIIDFYLDRKAHVAALDDERARNALADQTVGYSPVMIEHLFDEALVWALRRNATALDAHDLHEARLVTMAGLRNPVTYTDEERRVIATHEAGHATLAWLAGQVGGASATGRSTPGRRLELLSIVKRGGALGLLQHGDQDERFTRSQRELESFLRISLAGLVAEQLAFGETSTGPSEDLRYATQIAAEMVGAYGMAGSLVSFQAAAGPGHPNLVASVLADEASRAQVERLLEEARADVERALHAARPVWEALRDALLERDELVGAEITAVIERAEPADLGATASPDVLDLRVSAAELAP